MGALLAGIKLRQDLLADFVEDLCRVARPVLQVQYHVVDTDRTQPFEVAEQGVPAAANAEVDWLRWLIWVVAQIDVERLGERFERARGDGLDSTTPA